MDSCAICFADFGEDEIVAELDCNKKHIFHEKCIREWVDKTPECPLCK